MAKIDFSFDVPEKAPVVEETVPPAGQHEARIVRAECLTRDEGKEEARITAIRLVWVFKAAGKDWELEQTIPWGTYKGEAMFAQIGVAAGFASTTIKTLDSLLGIDMLIEVVTYGGRSSAAVKRVMAVTDK